MQLLTSSLGWGEGVSQAGPVYWLPICKRGFTIDIAKAFQKLLFAMLLAGKAPLRAEGFPLPGG